jgi:hypothetical protein
MVEKKMGANSISSLVSIFTFVAFNDGPSTVELILALSESALIAVGSIAALPLSLVSPSPLAQKLAVKK